MAVLENSMFIHIKVHTFGPSLLCLRITKSPLCSLANTSEYSTPCICSNFSGDNLCILMYSLLQDLEVVVHYGMNMCLPIVEAGQCKIIQDIIPCERPSLQPSWIFETDGSLVVVRGGTNTPHTTTGHNCTGHANSTRNRKKMT